MSVTVEQQAGEAEAFFTSEHKEFLANAAGQLCLTEKPTHGWTLECGELVYKETATSDPNNSFASKPSDEALQNLRLEAFQNPVDAEFYYALMNRAVES